MSIAGDNRKYIIHETLAASAHATPRARPAVLRDRGPGVGRLSLPPPPDAVRLRRASETPARPPQGYAGTRCRVSRARRSGLPGTRARPVRCSTCRAGFRPEAGGVGGGWPQSPTGGRSQLTCRRLGLVRWRCFGRSRRGRGFWTTQKMPPTGEPPDVVVARGRLAARNRIRDAAAAASDARGCTSLLWPKMRDRAEPSSDRHPDFQ